MRSFFRDRNRNDHNRRAFLRKKRFSLESLEDRLLLTAVPNDWGILAQDLSSVGPSSLTETGLRVSVDDGGTAVIGLLVSADGDVDPGRIRVRDAAGEDVTESVLMKSLPDYTADSGLFLLNIPDGEYELVLSSEPGTAGDLVTTVFLPGDTDGDGLIDLSEYKLGTVYATAWDICCSGNASLGVIQYYLNQYGIDLTDPAGVYNPRYDVNMDGVVNCADKMIFRNGYESGVSVSFFDLVDIARNDRSLETREGETGYSDSETALAPDSFTAVFAGETYISNGYAVSSFTQTGAELSSGGTWSADCSGLVRFDSNGQFVFDASPELFESLTADETLTLTFEYYLNDLTFDGLDRVFQNVGGGTLTVVVDGVNDAPRGAADYETVYNMASTELAPTVNVMSGVTDPEGETLTPAIVSAAAAPNRYGIPAGTDYSGCFTVSGGGVFGVDGAALDELLAAVPSGERIVFTAEYAVSDPHGASDGGKVTLTVVGKNDAPYGAGDITAVYDLADGSMTPAVDLLEGVIDPDSDLLTVSIDGASLGKNGYGIDSDADYTAYFSVDDEGGLVPDQRALARLLKAVPAGGTVQFTIPYSVSDPYGAETGGRVFLTVAGVNDAPDTPADIRLVSSMDDDGALTFAANLLADLTDPDGDILSVGAFTIGGETYAAAAVSGLEADGYIYTYDAETGDLAVTATEETAETLRWMYNETDGTLPLTWFSYQVTDGSAAAQGIVSLFFEAADDPARFISVPGDVAVIRNSEAEAGDTVFLGDAQFLADGDQYDVLITVTDEEGETVNTGLMEDLVFGVIYGDRPDYDLELLLDDHLANLLDSNVPYTVTYELAYGGVSEDSGSFTFMMIDLQVDAWTGTVSVDEGETAYGDRTLEQNAYTAQIDGNTYTSASFSVGDIVQVSASTPSGPVTGDFASSLSWNAETGYFTFDASTELFDFLSEGEVLTVTADFYLDGLRFGGLSDVYSNIWGGTVDIAVTGVNDAPSGAVNYSAVLDLTTSELSPTVNLLGGVTDPDGDALTASIQAAALAANDYGISTDPDYASYFSVSDGGVFAADYTALAELLTAVPYGETAVFRVTYTVSDPYGASDAGTVTLTVRGRNDAPSGAADYEAVYDLAEGTLDPEVNVLAAAADPDSDPLRASVLSAYAEENDYISSDIDCAACFGFGADGNFTVDGDAAAGLLAALPYGETVVFNVSYAVSDPYGASDSGEVSVTFLGCYDAPVFHGPIADVSGTYGGTVSLDLADYFTGAVAGYKVSIDGDSSVLSGYSLDGSVLMFNYIGRGDYASDLDLSDLAATVTAYDALGSKAVSNTFAVSLAGAQTLTLSLACVTEEFGGADVNTLRTGAGNFGTFYYVAGSDVPQTDYEAIAQADTYYLELWVSDVSPLLTGQNSFFYSIQAQLNYETDGLGITALDIEDVYAGKTSLTNFLYYDDAETLLKDIQVTWLFGSDKDWSLLEPITNGENAFLLARFAVTANTASSISLSGVTDPVSPFVDGYYCVRTGETAAIDDSQIRTVNVTAAGTSSIRGAAAAEYVADGGVYLRTVTEATETDAAGYTEQIGVNADFIHEWQTHYTEIWVKASPNEAISSVSVDLAFDQTCFEVSEIEFGASFAGGTYEYDAECGAIENISARAAGGALGGDGYVLLARVKYAPADGAGVSWSDSLSPVHLEWRLGSALLETAAGSRSAYTGVAASSDLWANPYDVNDDGEVNIIDFVAFINQYGGDSTESHAGEFFDFNRDGSVDLRDFTAFSNVYGMTRSDAVSGRAELVFPESFTRRYLGSTLDADNAQLVGAVCDAAAAEWNSALGLEAGPELTIVVKDLADGQLAASQAVETDPATGQVLRGTIYLDDDAAGARWSAQLTPPAAGSTRYDLYTVILHELGHLYGYDADNSAFVSVAGEFEWAGADGHSTDEADLMYPLLDPGVRKSVTVQDAAVVSAVRKAAETAAPDLTGAEFEEEVFAQFDTEAASWSLDFAEEVAEAFASADDQNTGLTVWDDSLDGNL